MRNASRDINKTMRILAAVLLCLALSVTLAGCGEDNARRAEAVETAGTLYLTARRDFDHSEWQNLMKMARTVPAQVAIEKTAMERAAQDAEQQKTDRQESVLIEVPKLPQTGETLSDFVPEGWTLMDSVELDFNRDTITDHVGVLNVIWREDVDYYAYRSCPRILFAIESREDGSYLLSFQDENLIRNINEGGIHGDPYWPLTAEGASFTTHSFGGSAWKWTEDYTYEYKDGTWYLTKSEDTYGYQQSDIYARQILYITSYAADDWEKGVGIRKRRSSNLNEMNEHRDEEPVYDIVYEVSLDEMPTIYQAGKRWWLAPDRVTDREVSAVIFSEDMDGMDALEKAGLAKKIEEALKRSAYDQYNDENCMLYVYTDQENLKDYAVMYRWEDKTLSVLAESETRLDDLAWYQGKIYYTGEIVENIAYRAVRNGEETIVREEDTVGLILRRMNEDGSEKEDIFEYRYPPGDQGIMEERPPYIAFSYEISGGEILLEVFEGGTYDFYYRMNIDGSNARQIGQVPA
ncbi:MAG: hypothetical protein NC079_10535 [Clostridium sp.]|nr:hypothetical protein [Acetatifactor muris]MCM1527904.1 hypothetical protein [Bacteroides sp.]MCM1564029.1 hypothetical protein [Clostridium sp.]